MNIPLTMTACVNAKPGRLAWLAGALWCGLLLSTGASAKLGGDLASVQSDAQAFGASSARTSLTGATRYNQTLPNGVTVRQFVDASGLVFAVVWQGPVLPDFERLLGAHYPAYAAALRQQARGVSLQGSGLVIESGGMMRAFVGRAYLPARLPAGLTAQDIR